jgi:hypothetical protein
VTLLQAAVATALIGCLLAAFTPTFLRELRLSKIAEAPRELEHLHEATSAYFAASHAIDAETLHRCLPRSAGPFPAEPTRDAHVVDFSGALSGDDDPRAGFAAIGFAVEDPVRYSYSVTPTVSGCDLRSPEGTYLVTYRAIGDLDGDGERSLFERRDRALDDEDLLEPVGILYVRDRTE